MRMQHWRRFGTSSWGMTMFSLLLLVLALVGADFEAFEDCSILLHEAPAPIVRAVEEWNAIPDDYRSC
jgi:hypothetical protein